MFYSEKGVSLFLTVVILGTILGIMLGISSLVLRQVMTVTGLGESVTALHAADSGIELLVYAIREEAYIPSCLGGGDPPCKIEDLPLDEFENEDLSYQLYLQSAEPHLTVRSIGQYRQTRRAIEVSF